MDEMRFWQIVQQTHDKTKGDMDQKCALLKDTLSKIASDEAKAFANIFDSMMDRSYTWALWGAAYIINGGCGDDTFSDFRASLISRSRSKFEQAVSDPDSMPIEDFDEETWFYEGYQYAVTDGVIAAVGASVDREKPYPNEPSGDQWDEDKVYDLYPKLSEKFA